MRRSIDGPDKDLLTKEEVCGLLRVSDRGLDALIAAGEFPRGVPYGRRSPILWLWQDVWAFTHLRSRLALAPEKSSEEGSD